MAPFRMPFGNRRGPVPEVIGVNDENSRPSLNTASRTTSKDSLALGVKNAGEQANEYKMSLVNDSGIYLPPSPTEKKSSWHTTATSTTSSNHRSLLSEKEPFSMTRESFDSYRRSFDISGRSPIRQSDSFMSRASMDPPTPRLPRSSVDLNTFQTPRSSTTTPEEEEFKEICLQDDPKPRRKNFLARFGDSTHDAANSTGETGRSRFGLHLPGRKRAQSAQGDELKSIERPSSSKV